MSIDENDMFHEGLQCLLSSITVGRFSIALHLPDDNCVDGSGAIALATAINPDVIFIATFSGTTLDTCYAKSREKWQAQRHPLHPRNPKARLS